MAPIQMSARAVIGSISQPYGLNDIGHQGLFHDEHVGLLYNRARHLHPKMGRFLQRDSAGYHVDGLNIYQYVRSDPNKYLDPTGNTSFSDHYRNGDSSTFDLGKEGYLGKFQSASTVKQAQAKLITRIRQHARGVVYNLDCNKKRDSKIHGHIHEPIDFTVSSLYPLGNGLLQAKYLCEVWIGDCHCCDGNDYPQSFGYTCNVTYIYQDSISDPFEHDEAPETHTLLDAITWFGSQNSVSGIGGGRRMKSDSNLGDAVPREAGTPYPIFASYGGGTVSDTGQLPTRCY